jgi:hypothetical protein
MNAQESRDEFRANVISFIAEAGRVLESHAVGLRSQQENIKAAFKTAENHHDCIQSLRTDVEGLAQLVNEQTHVVAALQGTMLAVLKRLGMDEEIPSPPPMPN